MPVSNVRQVATAKLRQNPANNRTHPNKQIAQLASIIKAVGFLSPIVADDNFVVQAGHGRLLAAQRLGLQIVPVITVSGRSEAKRRTYVLADNKLSEKGGWNRLGLVKELDGLRPDVGMEARPSQPGDILDAPSKEQAGMSGYKVLGERGWKRRRTIADAIEVLHEDVGFGGDDRAQIRVGPMRLPSGVVASVVGVFFDNMAAQTTFIVWLPTAVQFRAILPDQPEIYQFDIDRLQEAWLDCAGYVELFDGTRMRAVEIIPASLPYKISDLDEVIVTLAISMIDAQDRCSYSSGGSFSEHPQDDPYRGFIDCSKLGSLSPFPGLKVIKGYIQDREPRLALISEQKISDTLRKFGMRIPVARPRQV